jgi:DNA-binding NarL/FixJ family response regulator
MIKILLVDDEPDVILGWRMRLGLEPDLSIVGEADRAAPALILVAAAQPHIILLDLRLHGYDSTSLIQQFLAAAPGSRVIVVTLYDDARHRSIVVRLWPPGR